MAIAKYLNQYAEAEARIDELSQLRDFGPWDHAITIPLRRESIDCLAGIAAAAAAGPTLAVLVVNAGVDLADQQINTTLIRALAARARPIWTGPGLALCRLPGFDALLVDRSTPPRGFAARDGVGLARKLGADLLVRLRAEGLLRSPWIHTTDADAELPAAHFERIEGLDPTKVSAAVAPFRHVEAGDPPVHAATLRYELSLRYYVLGLRSAGSAYAFHTIGSLISVANRAYAQARGFPRREAGEDFYMLNKLAKLGTIARLGGAPVRLRSRRSTRAPFGTGPAVEALLAGKPFAVYDPRVFAALGRANRALCSGELDALTELPELRAWAADARELARRYPPAQRAARARERFDGFRTLKLIHALTERWPKQPWPAAVAAAPFVPLDPTLPLADQREQLAALEQTA